MLYWLNYLSSIVNWLPTQVKLNIHQLTFAKLAQLSRHGSVNTRGATKPRVPGSIPIGDKLFAKLNFLFTMK